MLKLKLQHLATWDAKSQLIGQDLDDEKAEGGGEGDDTG